MRAREVIRRSTATLLMATTTLSGCTSWKAQPVTPEVLSSQHPSKIRVHRIDGSTVVLHGPSYERQ